MKMFKIILLVNEETATLKVFANTERAARKIAKEKSKEAEVIRCYEITPKMTDTAYYTIMDELTDLVSDDTKEYISHLLSMCVEHESED